METGRENRSAHMPTPPGSARRAVEIFRDLRGLYGDFNAFSQEVLREMDVIISENPGAWTEFNVPRPAAGTPAAG